MDKEYKWVKDKTNFKKINFLERDFIVSLKLIKSLTKRKQYKNPRYMLKD